MSLRDNATEQREYLERNLEQLNTVISAILGYKTKLEIEEITNKKGTYFKLVDCRNLKEKCGVMAKAFTNVYISSFNVRWNDKGVYISFDFLYKHINGGGNGAEFCEINIVDNLVSIVER